MLFTTDVGIKEFFLLFLKEMIPEESSMALKLKLFKIFLFVSGFSAFFIAFLFFASGGGVFGSG